MSNTFSSNQFSLSIANAFSGGVFLMLSFGHMIPHAIETFRDIGVPLENALYFTVAGYLIVLFIEKILFNSHALLHDFSSYEHGHSASTSPSESHGHRHSHRHDPSYCEVHPAETTSSTLDSAPVPTLSSVTTIDIGHDHRHGHGHHGHGHHVPSSHQSSGGLSPQSAVILLTAMSVHRYSFAV